MDHILPDSAGAVPRDPLPFRILQFGEGNFMRAFADDLIDRLNEETAFNAGVILVRPRGGNRPELRERFRAQQCRYHVCLRGLLRGRPVREVREIRCVRDLLDPVYDYEEFLALAGEPDLRFIFSNTTESGIRFVPEDTFDATPPVSFPGKITRFLFERYRHFDGDPARGLVFLPAELIDRNGEALRSAVLQTASNWELPEGFTDWILTACRFHNTLVDRIVTGYPADPEGDLADLAASDPFLIAAEPYASWVIEDPEGLLQTELPFDRTDLPVLFVPDVMPYKERKVRILNGAHTSFVPLAIGLGYRYVNQAMGDPMIEAYLRLLLHEEILPTLPLPEEQLTSFAADVLDRFRNPDIDHALADIAKNDLVKWGTRCLPSYLADCESGPGLPKLLTFSLACLADSHGLDADGLLNAVEYGDELDQIPGLRPALGRLIGMIRENGYRKALEDILREDEIEFREVQR